MHYIENDWTKNFSRKELADKTNQLIDNIIISLYLKKIDIFQKHSLSKEELGILLRWSLYVSTNTFIERLISVLNKEDIFPKNNTTIKSYAYYLSILDFTRDYYDNNELNNKLILDIISILKNN